MTYDITRNYDSEFSATQVKQMLNNIAGQVGKTNLETPVKAAKPFRPDEDEFDVELRPTVDVSPSELFGGSHIEGHEVTGRVLGWDQTTNTVRLRFKKA